MSASRSTGSSWIWRTLAGVVVGGLAGWAFAPTVSPDEVKELAQWTRYELLVLERLDDTKKVLWSIDERLRRVELQVGILEATDAD